MIKYKLLCNFEHEFEGWFRNSEAFDQQSGAGHVSCPSCGSTDVSKAIMAPNVVAKRSDALPVRTETAPNRQREILAALRKLRSEVEARSTYVGERFAEEARKIHFGETEERSVYGEATKDEVASLAEDGVPVLPLPRLPKDIN